MPEWVSSLRSLIANASPLRRTALVLLVLVPLAALGLAYLWSNPPAYRLLLAGLSPRAGGEVIAALERLDIPYRLSASDGGIEVPAAQLHEARYRLAALGLPRSDEDAHAAVLDVPRFGASSLEEQQRYQQRLERELARSIQALEPVELARVHLALPKTSPFLRDGPSATAAVLMRVHPDARLDAGQVATVQALVAASVPRMKPSDVQVLDMNGTRLGGTSSDTAASPRMALESDLAQRVLGVLTPWLGADRVRVQVTAVLDDGATGSAAGVMQTQDTAIGRPSAPDARLERLNAMVILGFDADADQLQRVEHLAREALALVPERGDSLKVYALPAAARQVSAPAVTIAAAAPEPAVRAAGGASPGVAWRPHPGWLALAAAIAFVLIVVWRRRAGSGTVAERPADDFDAMLAAARSQALGDPRVTADVIKLWMRT